MNNLFFDIETGKASDYALFEPEYKEPRVTKTGAIHASDKSIEEQKKDWEDKCCVSPITGRIIMIGDIFIKDYECAYESNDNEEHNLLKYFWNRYNKADFVIGFDIKRFDLPFIIKRSWKYRLDVPNLIDKRGYFESKILDLREILACGEWQPKGSLNDYCKFFGLEEKEKGVGENFEKIWQLDKPKAFKYNKTEVENIQNIFNIINK